MQAVRVLRGRREGAGGGFRRRPERAFYFRLALALGRTVGELLARIDSRELSEWKAYERLYGPLGPSRDDQLMAILAATTRNSFISRESDAVTPADFMPDWAEASRMAEEAARGDDP